MIKKRKGRILRKGKAYMVATWSRFKSGDRYAFEEIYSEFVESLFAYGIKISGKLDLKQNKEEVFKYLALVSNSAIEQKSGKHYLIK